MASMRDIKRRKGSIQSTQQITKAMKLVSTVKLQKAKNRAEETNPYFNYMYQTVSSMLRRSGTILHPYLKANDSQKKAVVVITSNRGLAGGYNSNVVKLVTGSGFSKEDVQVYAIGHKGREALERYGYEIKSDDSEVVEAPTYADAAVSHEPKMMKLLPVEFAEGEGEAEDTNVLMNYEPDEEEALDMIIPKYITSLFYGALVEAVASENGARMQAMDSATSNAEEMISDLSLKYNRARQSSITQELTEIIAGASAIS